jgi:hypothetical protein
VRNRRATAFVTRVVEPELPAEQENVYLHAINSTTRSRLAVRALAGASAIDAISSFGPVHE